MPKSRQRKIINYNANDLFNIVLDIESYPEFIPWCSNAEIISKKKNNLVADLIIRYKYFNETFRSYVYFHKKDLIINVKYTEGPLKFLKTNWNFKKISKDKTEIIFDIDIKFKFSFFNNLLKSFFNMIESKMIKAFEKRAKDILSKKIN